MSACTRLGKLARWWPVPLISLFAACTGDQAPPRGELMVSLVTDMSVPKDVTHIRVKVKRDDEVREERDFFVAPDGEFSLPGTIAIIEGSTPAPVVSVEVVGIRTPGSGTPEARTFSKVTTTIPRERIALLRVPVQWLCDETAVDDGTGSYVTSCPPIDGEEAACVAGRCQLVEIDSSTLPTFDPRDVFGGGESADDPLGSCFDTLECFDRGVDVDRDDLGEDCTLEIDDDDASYNVALRLAEGEAGICHVAEAEPCYVPLDQDDLWGWRYGEDPPDGKVQLVLPPAVCDRLDEGHIEAVRVTTVCETKTGRSPTCGPWSEVTQSTSGEGGAGAQSGAGGTTATGTVGGTGGTTGANDVGGTGGTTATDSGGTGGATATGNVGGAGGATATGNVGGAGGTATTSGGGGNSSTGGTGQVSECQDPLVFADPNLESAVRNTINVPSDPISAAAVAVVEFLTINGATDLDGIQCLPNLTNLILDGSVRPNLAPLEEVALLSFLSITNSELPDITPLGSLTHLVSLAILDSTVGSVDGLGSLTNLISLDLNSDNITDIAALGTLTNLTNLSLSDNDISDITALGTLTNLTSLNLSLNPLGDIAALEPLTRLVQLSLAETDISDVSALGTLTNLNSLVLNSNDISDITALGNLTALNSLEIHSNNISNVSALATLTNLTHLHLDSNSISDITALGTLTNLGTLYLASNSISDISALGTLTNLFNLYLSSNSIDDITALGPLAYLFDLNLSSNDITDLAPLADGLALGAGGTLDVTNNPFDCGAQAANLSVLEGRDVILYASCP